MKLTPLAGVRAVMHALTHCPSNVEALYIETESPRLAVILKLAKEHGISVQVKTKKDLDQLEATHQGVVAMLAMPTVTEDVLLNQLVHKKDSVVVLLDEVQDPQNVGAILRSCAAYGVDAVITPERNACGLTPASRKAAQGGDLVVPLIQVTNLARFMRQLKDAGFWLVGTAIDPTAQSIEQCDLKGKIAIVLGAEGQGIRQNTQKNCDFLAYIPLKGPIESLNVSVAAGICLYEWMRQQPRT